MQQAAPGDGPEAGGRVGRDSQGGTGACRLVMLYKYIILSRFAPKKKLHPQCLGSRAEIQRTVTPFPMLEEIFTSPSPFQLQPLVPR
jgi:hypothetical protein